jgi:parallel beta helix pectate lyase-like protein
MRKRLTLAAAAVLAAGTVNIATAATAHAAPPEIQILAERVINCTNNANVDSRLIAATLARSADGDAIVFDGTCLVTQTIPLLGNRSYQGRSRTGTVIQQADGANLPAIFASDSYLDNSPTTGRGTALRTMTIKANSATNPDAADAVVLRSWQTFLEDVQISDATRHAIRLTNLSANGTPLTNTQVNGRIAENQINRSGGSGLFVEDTGNSVTDWQLEDNYIAGTGGDGIRMDNAAGWMISSNHIYDVDGDNALYANRLYGSSISDNYIEDFGTTGILARVQGGAASTITTNRIFQNAGRGGTFLQVLGNYGNAKAAVNSNTIRGRGLGIGLDYQRGTATSLEVTSSGNLVTEVEIDRQVGEGVTINPGTLSLGQP